MVQLGLLAEPLQLLQDERPACISLAPSAGGVPGYPDIVGHDADGPVLALYSAPAGDVQLNSAALVLPLTAESMGSGGNGKWGTHEPHQVFFQIQESIRTGMNSRLELRDTGGSNGPRAPTLG
jgi:hypothetical protein